MSRHRTHADLLWPAGRGLFRRQRPVLDDAGRRAVRRLGVGLAILVAACIGAAAALHFTAPDCGRVITTSDFIT